MCCTTNAPDEEKIPLYMAFFCITDDYRAKGNSAKQTSLFQR